MSSVDGEVEDENQLQFLLDNGFDQIQGYYFSKPILIGDFDQYVLTKNK